MDNKTYWVEHSIDILDKLVDVYQKIQIPDSDVYLFKNSNFDKVLELIGEYYANRGEMAGTSAYSTAYEKIVEHANFNNRKKSRYKYWVTKKQIKSLRRAYKKIYASRKSENEAFFVKIPYNTIYILNTICELAELINPVNEYLLLKKVSEYLAEKYIEIYKVEWNSNMDELQNIERAQQLYNEIFDDNQQANQIYKGR